MRVKRLEVVVVAAIVVWEFEATVVVPMASQSELVVSLTIVPSSVNPETLEAEIAPQIMFPEESVVRALEEEQVWTVEILRPPARTSSPRKVLVAVLVCKIFPPVIVSPEAEESPPAVSTLIPPAKVEVAVPEALIVEPVCNSPETESLPPIVEEAWVKSPDTNWERFCTEREEEAEIGPAA